MDTGEWTSHGQFLKKDKAGTEIPNGLQQIKVEDLVKVGQGRGERRSAGALLAEQPSISDRGERAGLPDDGF